MQRFATVLHRSLLEAGHDVRIARPVVAAGKFSYGPVSGKWLGHIDKFVLFPISLRKLASWADIVHICDHSNSSYVRYVNHRPHLVTCHDMLAIRSALGLIPGHSTGWTGRKLQHQIVTGLALSQHIVCVSDATRHDLQRIIDVDDCKISRIYNGLNYQYAPMERSRADTYVAQLLTPDAKPFILHVGGNQWYKNRLGVLRLFSNLQKRPETRHLKLVMVGKPWTQEMKQFSRQARLNQVAFELTGVSEEELRALYSSAELMLFPSLEEGFGWPIAEAQACGCPVVTTDRAPMTEVGGEAAFYANPLDSDAVTKAVISALNNKKDLREGGFMNVSRFSTLKMVDAYAELYTMLGSSAN